MSVLNDIVFYNVNKPVKGELELNLSMQKKIIAIISIIIILTVSIVGTLSFIKANNILKLNFQSEGYKIADDS